MSEQRIQLSPTILELQNSNDIYMTLKLILLTSNVNLNGARFTEDFINGIVENQEKYIGIPLVVNRTKLENEAYDSLSHEFDGVNLKTDVIGAFVSFEKQENEDGSLSLLGESRIYKRFPKTCEAIIELYQEDKLRFSCEVLVQEYGDIKDGIREIPYADGKNNLFGQAIVTNPAEPNSRPTILIAALEEDLLLNMGTDEKIEIDNSKDSASDTPWGEVDKTELRNKILKASNYKSLVKECYLICENGWEDAPSEHLKYPHHEIKNNKLVISKTGIVAARQRLAQYDPNNSSAINHLKEHYDTCGMSWDDFSMMSSKGGRNMSEVFNKGHDIKYHGVIENCQLSFEEIAKQIYNALNYDTEGNFVANYFIVETFPDHVIIQDWEQDDWYSVAYSVTESSVFIAPKEEWIQGKYEFVPNGQIGVTDPKELAKENEILKQKIEQLNNEIAQLNDKDDAIIKLNNQIEELKNELASLQPIKEEYERIQEEKRQAELLQKQESLKIYALNSKVIDESEFETNEELKNAILELNEQYIKSLIADRIVFKVKELELNNKKSDDVVITVSSDGKDLIPEDKKSILYKPRKNN